MNHRQRKKKFNANMKKVTLGDNDFIVFTINPYNLGSKGCMLFKSKLDKLFKDKYIIIPNSIAFKTMSLSELKKLYKIIGELIDAKERIK